jgi:hypothetical protein
MPPRRARSPRSKNPRTITRGKSALKRAVVSQLGRVSRTGPERPNGREDATRRRAEAQKRASDDRHSVF